MSSEDPRQVHLAATRTDVHIINGEKLKELHGEMKVFKSNDAPGISKRMRKHVDAPINLALKLNAPVVLTVNLSHKLVNGLSGYVKEMNDSDVVVYFPDLKEMHTIGPYNFFVYSAKQKRNIFVTSQIPLILAFSLTIHKSQGMTLDSVCIECAGAFQAGQISVALGRVRAAKDITVMNFRPSLCPPHPPVVNAFYGTQSETVTANQSCCKLKLPACSSSVDVTSPVMESNADGSHPDETVPDSETEDDCDDDSAPNNAYYLFCDDPQTNPQIQYPDELNGAYMRSAMVIDDPFTDTHTLMNECLEDISDFDLFNWGRYLYNHIATHSALKYTKVGDTKQINAVVHDFTNVFTQSPEFRSSASSLFRIPLSSVQQHHVSLSMSALLAIQDLYFACRAKVDNPTDTAPSTVNIPAIGCDAKIRYVAGMCVGRVIYKECDFVCRNIHTDDTKVKQKRDLVCSLKKHVYNTIHIAQCETSHPLSLTEIVHRQSKYGHLTIVDDRLFQLFKEFDNHLHSHLNMNTMRFNDDKFFDALLSNTLHDVMTETDVCTSCPDFSASLLRPVFAKYLRVCLKELGIRITNTLNIKKKVAHRKQVLLDECTVPKFTKIDTQQTVANKPSLPQAVSATAEDVTIPAECTASPSADIHSLSTTEPTSNEEYHCAMCKGPYVANRLNWIECTSCQQWLHRKCDSTLKTQKKWKAVIGDGAVYHCPQCRKGEWNHRMRVLTYLRNCGEVIVIRIVHDLLFTPAWVLSWTFRGCGHGQWEALPLRDTGAWPSTMAGIAFLQQGMAFKTSHNITQIYIINRVPTALQNSPKITFSANSVKTQAISQILSQFEILSKHHAKLRQFYHGSGSFGWNGFIN